MWHDDVDDRARPHALLSPAEPMSPLPGAGLASFSGVAGHGAARCSRFIPDGSHPIASVEVASRVAISQRSRAGATIATCTAFVVRAQHPTSRPTAVGSDVANPCALNELRVALVQILTSRALARPAFGRQQVRSVDGWPAERSIVCVCQITLRSESTPRE